MHAHIRQDLFGFADCVAIRADVPGVLAVNAMGAGALKSHMRLLELPALKVWLAAGNRFEMQLWKQARIKKYGPKRWQVKVIEVKRKP
jgi:hypothetical protein